MGLFARGSRRGAKNWCDNSYFIQKLVMAMRYVFREAENRYLFDGDAVEVIKVPILSVFVRNLLNPLGIASKIRYLSLLLGIGRIVDFIPRILMSSIRRPASLSSFSHSAAE